MAIDIQCERKEEVLTGILGGRIDTTNADELQNTLDTKIVAEDHAFGFWASLLHQQFRSSGGSENGKEIQ